VRPRAEFNVRRIFYFQLPLSGSLNIIRVILILQARVLMRLTFLSTPSLGITERHFVFVGGGKCPRLSTPSLGITHGEKPDRSADRPRDFQLPLSGSPKINWGALLRQAILHFQLPLSGSRSHVLNLEERKLSVNTLSTPSLGITY